FAAHQLQLRAEPGESVLRPGPPAIEGSAPRRNGLRAAGLRDPARPVLLPQAARRRPGRGDSDVRAAGDLDRGNSNLPDPPGVEIPPRRPAGSVLDKDDDADAGDVHLAGECGARVDDVPDGAVGGVELYRALDRPNVHFDRGAVPDPPVAAARQLAARTGGLGSPAGARREVAAVPAESGTARGQTRRPRDALVQAREEKRVRMTHERSPRVSGRQSRRSGAPTNERKPQPAGDTRQDSSGRQVHRRLGGLSILSGMWGWKT